MQNNMLQIDIFRNAVIYYLSLSRHRILSSTGESKNIYYEKFE